MSKPIGRRAIATGAIVALLTISSTAQSGSKVRIDPVSSGTTQVFSASYFDVASHGLTTASGYGGSGASGGSGDALMRIVNPTAAFGTLCGLIYVFDDIEEIQACCACPVTSDGLVTLSVLGNLTDNLAVKGGNRVAGVVALFSSLPLPPQDSTQPIPNGAVYDPVLNLECDPGCGFLGGGSQCVAVDDPSIGTTALRAAMNHTESMAPTSAPFQFVTGTAVEEFQPSFIPAGDNPPDLVNLIEGCGTLQANFTGSGICTCPSSGI